MASSQILIPPYDRDSLTRSSAYSPSFHQSLRRDQANDEGLFSSAMLDKVGGERNPRAMALAVVINGILLLAVLWIGQLRLAAVVIPASAKVVTLIAPVMTAPLPKAPPKPVVMSGGGGQPMPQPVARGNPPKLEVKPILMVAAAPARIAPRLTVEPTLNVQPEIKMAKLDVPTMGMTAAAPTVVASMGNGTGAGLGAGIGNGMGSGSGGNYGGGVFKIGGGVTKPEVISAPDPGFTEEARQARVAGKVVVYLQVNAQGQPMHVKVIHGLGMGLDEKAVEAVRQYRFKPAMKDGQPVTVEMNVDVNFQIL